MECSDCCDSQGGYGPGLGSVGTFWKPPLEGLRTWVNEVMNVWGQRPLVASDARQDMLLVLLNGVTPTSDTLQSLEHDSISWASGSEKCLGVQLNPCIFTVFNSLRQLLWHSGLKAVATRKQTLPRIYSKLYCKFHLHRSPVMYPSLLMGTFRNSANVANWGVGF